MRAFWALALAVAAAAGAAPGAGAAMATVADGVQQWNAGHYDAAVAQWVGPAARGDGDALFYLGQAYKLGRGVAENRATAIDYYRRAAEKGQLAALTNLGITLYQDGRKTEAMNWLRRGADRGDPRASYVLGVATFGGDGAKQNRVLGYAYVLRASDGGLELAGREAARMATVLTVAERTRAVAVAASLAGGETTDGEESDPGGRPVVVAASDPAPKTAKAAGKAAAKPAATPAASPSASSPAASPAAEAEAWKVQLGAYSSERAARNGWATLASQASPSLGGLLPIYTKTGRLIRLQIGPYPTRAEADALCARLAAAGRACFVTR